ncbi:MAG: Peroxide-responsive repressor PerR [candidate division BRC1 bacterium ADurb.BinA364]|nr:MAG: Peroxide-responsive repressor PerR [candidate division BRC1 bacterium ADurb.BinA364]
MRIDRTEVSLRMERFETACRGAGIKITNQRVEIFREVAQTGDHPDAETVYRGVSKRLPRVSLDTVYRTLWMLKDLGLIGVLGASRDRARFDANLAKHHHFICQQCGLARDFASDAFDQLPLPESLSAIGRTETLHIEARGLCLRCAANPKPQSTKPEKESMP